MRPQLKPISAWSKHAERQDCSGHRRYSWHRPRHCPGTGQAGCDRDRHGDQRRGCWEDFRLSVRGGVKGKGVALNVTDVAQTDAALAEIAKEFGAITILVNNAGITRDNLAMRMGDDEWDAVIDTNLKAVFRLSRGVMRGMMKARFGRIVNISSVVGYSGNAGQANYCAAKAGVAGLSRSLARELGSRNITVNCVAPGFIATDMTHALTEEQKAAMLAIHSAGPCRYAGRCCRRCRLSGFSCRLVCHGYHRACEWRHVYGLISLSLGFW
jgi:NAD(P)-dependent dehydrogenase (short-subunit alcohol dehydrogenase family)